jgi:hypothetical protein
MANVFLREKMFVSYVMFSSAASHDLHACRGIGRKRYLAFVTLELESLRCRAAALGEVFLGKQEFEMLLQVCCWIFS